MAHSGNLPLPGYLSLAGSWRRLWRRCFAASLSLYSHINGILRLFLQLLQSRPGNCRRRLETADIYTGIRRVIPRQHRQHDTDLRIGGEPRLQLQVALVASIRHFGDRPQRYLGPTYWFILCYTIMHLCGYYLSCSTSVCFVVRFSNVEQNPPLRLRDWGVLECQAKMRPRWHKMAP